MNKTGVVSFVKGMNLDVDISLFQQGNYLYAQNLRLSEGINKMGSLANIQGNVSLGQLPSSPRILEIAYNSGVAQGVWPFKIGGITFNFAVNPTNVNTQVDSLIAFIESHMVAWGINYYVNGNKIFIYSNNTSTPNTGISFPCPNFAKTTVVFNQQLKVIGSSFIRNYIYLFCAYDTTDTPTGAYGYIYKLAYDNAHVNFNPSYQIVYAGILELSTKHPIDCVSRFETSTIQKLYWTDNYNALRYINVADTECYKLLPNELDIVSDVLLSQPYITSITSGGSYNAGKIQYAYQLYDEAGTDTVYSPVSVSFNLYADSVDASSSYQVYGSDFEDNSGKSVTVKIDSLDATYRYIRIVALLYEKANEDPTITIVADDIVPDNGTYEFTDNGTNNLGSVTVDEFTIFGNQTFTAKTLASKDNYLLAGNITYQNFDVDFDARAYRFNNAKKADLYSTDGTYVRIDGPAPDYTLVPDEHDCINQFNSYDHDTNLSKHYKYQADGLRLGAEGPNIKINFALTTFILNDINQPLGLPDNLNSVRINEDITTYAGHSVINTSYRNYSSPYIAAYMVGYQRNEVYRLSIRFINDKGQRSFAKWICDMRMPHVADQDSVTTFSLDGTDKDDFRISFANSMDAPLANVLYLQFEIDTSSLPSNVVGYEILRVKRTAEDRTIMGQGLIWATQNSGSYYREHYPTNIAESRFGKLADNVVSFISPEITMNRNLSFSSGDKMNIIGCYYTADPGGKAESDKTYTNDSKEWSLVFAKKGTYPDMVHNATHKWYDTKWMPGIGDARYISPGESVYPKTFLKTYTGTDLSKEFANYSDLNKINTNGNDGDDFKNVNTGNYACLSGTKLICTLQNIPYPIAAYEHNYYQVNYFRKRISQYGGNSYVNRTRSEYIPVAFVLNRGGVQNTNVFGGDTFVAYFDHAHLLPWDGKTNQMQATVLIPVETSINLTLKQGASFSRRDNNDKWFYSETDIYDYNSVYSYDATIQVATSEQINQNEEDHYDCRILISEQKTNGEEIDQWTKFLVANFYDLDTAFGPINKLIFHSNYIFAFQDLAFGVTSINERSLITDNSVATGLAIGTGEVLKRFDYLSQSSGTKHQWSVMSTTNGLYWYDIVNNSIMSYTGKSDSLTDVKGLRSYLFEVGQTSRLFDHDNPHDYCGVNVCYDPLFDEVNFSFKDYYPIGVITLTSINPFLYTCASSTFVTEMNYAIGDTIKIYTADKQRLEFVLGYDGANYTLTSDQDYSIPSITNWIAYRAYSTVSYSDLFGCFQSFYTFNSEHYITHNGSMFSIDRKTNGSDYVYIHKKGNYGEFYGVSDKSLLTIMMNDSYPYTKIYDNMVVSFTSYGGLINNHRDFFDKMRCYNDRQITGWKDFLYKTSMSTLPTDTEVLTVKREDKFTLFIPKNIATVGEVNVFDTNSQDATRTFKDRMRDKYMVSEFVYNNEDNNKINISMIAYSYRISVR